MPGWDVHFGARIRSDEPRLIRAIERSRAIAETIRGVPVIVGVRKRLNALNIARAVRGTAAIEGTRISETEALEVLEAAPDQRVLPPDRARDEREARNAQAVMEFVQNELRESPGRRLDERLIRRIHRLTTEGVPYPENDPGRYRNHAVTVGNYRPPASGEEICRLMAEFVQWFNEGEAARLDPIIRAVVAHFYVISIHPFGDGNGRTSRAVESFMLYRAGINAFGFYSLANFYYQHRDEYINELTAARFRWNGDLTQFALFAIEGLADELAMVREELLELVRIMAFRDYARETLDVVPELGDRRRARMLELIRQLTNVSLIGMPNNQLAMDVAVSTVYGKVGQRTVQRDLRLLEEVQLLVERNGRLVPNVEIMSEFAEA